VIIFKIYQINSKLVSSQFDFKTVKRRDSSPQLAEISSHLFEKLSRNIENPHFTVYLYFYVY